jgi:hypothetical protein
MVTTKMVLRDTLSILDISSHLGKRSYLPWEWEFPRRYIPPTLVATLGLDLPPWQLAPTNNNIDRSTQRRVTNTSQKAHYFANQLNSKANQHLATYQYLAFLSRPNS